MKRLIYILVAFTALLTAACSQTIVFDEINEVVPPVSTTIQDNQIWYTTTNAKVVSTIMSGVVSNTYENGKGIITFDRQIDVITVDAFYNCAELKSVQLPQTVMAIEETAFGQCTSLSSIKLSNELRNIGPQAFSGCTALVSITIPDSVEQIEQRTFCDCTALKSVTFGATSRDASSSNLRIIGQCAFQNCTSLVNITLPSKLEIIAEDAFTNCTSLISITIPQSVNHVENNVFIGCSSLKEFNGKFATSDSRSLVRDRELIAFAPASLTEYTIDSDVVAIVGHVFSGCNRLQTVNIPSSVESVDEFSFWECSALKSITLPENVRFIGGSAFWQCASLASVYCKSITPPELGNDGVFDENKSGRKIYVPTIAVGDYKRAQHWSEYASAIEADKSEPIATDWAIIGSNCSWDFATATPMTISGNYAIANGVTFDSDGEFKFAANGSWDINYGLDSSVLITAGKTYQGVLSGENIKIAAGTYNIKFSIYDATFMVERVEISTNHLIFYASTDGNVVTPYAADVFGANIVSNTYAGDQGIITFDGDITKIGNSAFKQCNTLQAIIIPQSVTKIDHFAFTDCTNLTAINFPSGVTEIGNLAFNNCQSLESVVLPNSLTKIGTQAFYCCNSISSVTIPQSVTTISDNAFGFCASLAEFKGKFASEDGRCLVVNGTLNSFASAGVTEYTIPSSVTTIGHYAMHNSALLTTVTIPQSVQTVGDGAFNGCISLASVYCKPTTPPTGGSAMFDNNAANRKIYVSAASVDAYKTAAGWSNYADAIVAEGGDATIGGFDMVFVEGGTFTMGATSEQGSDYNSDECPTHSVTVSDFYIGRYEVTQTQWETVMGWNKSGYTGDKMSVEKVSWNDVQEFIAKLNAKTGKTFRLPTEAEWEYAARGGNKSNGYKYSGSNNLEDVAWYYDNSNKTHHPVGQKQQNELGIYDMSGNLWEWCQDWYGSYSSEAQTNPKGPSSGSHRILRGGCWDNAANNNRISVRSKAGQDFSNYLIGFRLACNSK